MIATIMVDLAKLYYPASADPNSERAFATCAKPECTAHEYAVLEETFLFTIA